MKAPTLFLLLFMCSGLHLKSWATTRILSPYAELSSEEYEQSSTFILAGSDVTHFYFVGTARIFDVALEELAIEELNTVFKLQLYTGTNKQLKKTDQVQIEVEKWDKKLNLTVLKVARNQLSNDNQEAHVEQLELGLAELSAFHRGLKGSINGFSNSTFYTLPTSLQGVRYYDDPTAFRIASQDITREHTGSVFISEEGYFLGIFQKLNSQNTAGRVFKTDALIAQLQGWRLPINQLKRNRLVGTWSAISTIQTHDLYEFEESSSKYIAIDESGYLSGFTGGQIKIRNNELTYFGSKGAYQVMMHPLPTTQNAYVMAFAILDNSRKYTCQFESLKENNTTVDYMVMTSEGYSVRYKRINNNRTGFEPPAVVLKRKINPTVKILLPDYEINGTGLIVGTNDKDVFIVTAAHTLSDRDKHNLPFSKKELIEVKVFVDRSDNLFNEFTISKGELLHFNHKFDIAVLKISIKNLPQTPEGDAIDFSSVPIGLFGQSNCASGGLCVLNGFSGGSRQNQDQVELAILSDPVPDHIQLEAEGVEGGHSGGPVFNHQKEWIGIMLQINAGGQSTKVISTEKVYQLLTAWNVPTNQIKNSEMVGTWQVIMQMNERKNAVYFPPCDKNSFTILQDGTVKGLVNGTVCIQNNTLRFSLSGARIAKIESTIFQELVLVESEEVYQLSTFLGEYYSGANSILLVKDGISTQLEKYMTTIPCD